MVTRMDGVIGSSGKVAPSCNWSPLLIPLISQNEMSHVSG